ncbi:MAG: hypothetical protein ACREHV_05115 [Rhizomicrobium sp.]
MARDKEGGTTVGALSIWHIIILFGVVSAFIPTAFVFHKAGWSAWWVALFLVPVVGFILWWVFALGKWPALENRHA